METKHLFGPYYPLLTQSTIYGINDRNDFWLRAGGLTQRAADGWESARSTGIFLASGLYCSQAVFSPAAANANRWAFRDSTSKGKTMNIKQAIELLKAKAETEEEKYALALLVLELDTQFCYGLGAGCTATADRILSNPIYADAQNASPNYENDVFGLAVSVADSPQMDKFRDDDFPQMDEFLKIRSDGMKLFEPVDNEFPF